MPCGRVFGSLVLFVGVAVWPLLSAIGAAKPDGRTAPKVALAKDGKALLSIFVALDGIKEGDLARKPDAWRVVLQTNTYKIAYFAQKVDVVALREEIRIGQALLMVDDLKRGLRRMVGVDFDFKIATAFPNKPGPGLYIGAVEDLKVEEFIHKTTGDGKILIAGGAWRGVSHGVYALLGKLGCRWYFPGETWEVVPEARDVSVALDKRGRPSFSIQRAFFMGHGEHSAGIRDDMRDWRRRNRMGAPFKVNISEGWPGFLRESFKDHPDWFALVDGKRQPSKPCYSNPEVVRSGIASALSYLRKHPGESMVSVSPPDGIGFCECKLCMKVAGVTAFRKEGYTLYGNKPDGTLVTLPSETCFNFANKIAEAVEKEFPGKYVGTLGYSSHAHPPSFDLRPNVYIEITRGYRRTPLTMDEQIRTFAGRCKQLGIYEFYDVEQWHWDKPGKSRASKLDAIQASIKYFHANNIRSIKGEMSNNWGPNGIGYYAIARLLWDVNADVRAIEEEFYQKAFGPAAEPLKRFYRRWEIGYPVDSNSLALAHKDLKEAVQLTKNDPASRARVDRIRMYLHFLKHYIHPNTNAAAMRKMFPNDRVKTLDPDALDIAAERRRLAVTTHTPAQERVDAFGTLVSRLMNTHMTHSFAFNSYLSKGAKVLGCDTKSWRKPGKIPTAKELDAFFAEDLKTTNLANLKDVPLKFYSHDLVALKTKAQGLLPAAPLPIRCGNIRRGSLLVLANRGERVRITLQDPVQRVRISYKVSFIPADDFAKGWGEFVHKQIASGKIEKGTANPVIAFQSPSGGYFRITWKADANLDMKGVAGVSHPAVFTGGMFFRSATLYFYVPKKTRRFAVETAAKGGPVITIADGKGNTALKVKREPGTKKTRRTFAVDVPDGSDGAIWSFTGPEDERTYAPIRLLGIPNYLSFQPDQLLVPVEAFE